MAIQDLKSLISQYLIHKTDFVREKERMTENELRVYVDRAITNLTVEQELAISTEERIALIRSFIEATVSLGPLRALMEDKDISEIMVIGPNKVFIQKGGKIELSNVKFESADQLLHTIQKLMSSSGSSGRLDESSPYVDFSLQDGSRLNAVVPPCAFGGAVVTIRKFSADINSVDHLINLKMFDKSVAVFLIMAMKAKLNIFFTGATGTGKTTALNIFSHHIPEEERIITIEDTPELRLNQEHVVTLLTKPPNIEGKGAVTLRDLFVNSLRMRPDRIIIGEVRSVEMLDLIQSISAGHSGSLAVVHADSPEDAFDRMITMMMMTGLAMTAQEIRKQVARAVDLIVHIELFRDGVRRITHITDIIYDRNQDETFFNHIFKFVTDSTDEDATVKGHWEKDSKLPSFSEKFARHNVKLPDGFFQS